MPMTSNWSIACGIYAKENLLIVPLKFFPFHLHIEDDARQSSNFEVKVV